MHIYRRVGPKAPGTQPQSLTLSHVELGTSASLEACIYSENLKGSCSCSLGISDHDMIYATLSAGIPRDPPKIITIRNFNKFSERNFQSDIARAPFQVCEVFDDPTDVYYSWNLLFTELCNGHAPFKQIKVRSNSLPWITKEIRTTMNHRYKALKKTLQLNANMG